MDRIRPKKRIRSRSFMGICFIILFGAFLFNLSPRPAQAKCYSGTVKCHCVCRAYDLQKKQINQKYTPGSRDVDTKHKHWYGGSCIPTKGADHALKLCSNSYSGDCKNLCTFWLKNNMNRIPSKKANYYIQVKSGDEVKFNGLEVRETLLGTVSP